MAPSGGFVTALLNATVPSATVLLLAGLGEVISERAGVLNLGVEGMMLVGALGGFATTAVTNNYWIGFGVGILLGMAMALIHAYLCISLKSNQVISGVMLTLLGTGLTNYFGAGWVEKQITGFPTIAIPGLAEIPYIGDLLFRNTATDFLAILIVPVVWYFLFRTNVGLELISVGEDPETADTMGVDVFKMRYLAVVIGGGFAGAAGAHLSLSHLQLWTLGITSGRGWIAVALVIFAQWQPARILAGAYLFGLLDVFQLRSQALDLTLGADAPLAGVLNPILEFVFHPSIMSTYPYIATIAVLWYSVAKTRSDQLAVPSALLQSYSRETD